MPKSARNSVVLLILASTLLSAVEFWTAVCHGGQFIRTLLGTRRPGSPGRSDTLLPKHCLQSERGRRGATRHAKALSMLSTAAASVSTASCKTTVFLVRHGARFDYADPEKWVQDCKELGIDPLDPPLSALGFEQARAAAKVLAGEGIEHILVSPYLRVIQTAQPLAHACNLGISVEDGLAELWHTPGSITPARNRYQYFPEVDFSYKALQPEACAGNKEETLDYLRRMLFMAEELPKKFAGSTIACFSHAASVALVSALAGTSLAEAGKFAPCGIFKLVKDEGAAQFTIEMYGADNSGHVTENHPSTFPWWFADHYTAEEAEAFWKEACRVGPTRIAVAGAE